MRKRIKSGGIVGVLLALGLLLSTPPASADDSVAARDTAQVLVSGTVTNTSRLLTAGALSSTEIAAQAWPRQATLAQMKPGDKLDLVTLSTTRINPDGTYLLTVPKSVSLIPYTNPDGSIDLNLDVHVNGGTVTVPVSTKVRPLGTPDLGTQRVSTVVPSLAVRQSGDAPDSSGGAPGVSSTGVVQTGSGTVTLDLGTAAAESAGSCYPGIGLGSRLVGTQPSWTISGQSFSNTSNADAQWTYLSGQTSTLGLSATASDGTWHTNTGYTNVTGNSSVTGFGTVSGASNYYYKIQFNVQKWIVDCQRNIDPTSRWSYYLLKPVSLYGGAWTQAAGGSGNAHNCSYYTKNNWLEVNKSTAITWNNGLSLSAFGVSLGASTQTGYSTKAKVKYTAARGAIYLCGDNGGPASTTAYVVSAATSSSGY